MHGSPPEDDDEAVDDEVEEEEDDDDDADAEEEDDDAEEEEDDALVVLAPPAPPAPVLADDVPCPPVPAVVVAPLSDIEPPAPSWSGLDPAAQAEPPSAAPEANRKPRRDR